MKKGCPIRKVLQGVNTDEKVSKTVISTGKRELRAGRMQGKMRASPRF